MAFNVPVEICFRKNAKTLSQVNAVAYGCFVAMPVIRLKVDTITPDVSTGIIEAVGENLVR